MKEFKGTKGEWKIGYDSGDISIHSKREIAGFDVIATAKDQFHHEQTVANAQLIAAAPELLKELIDFCKTFESTIGYQGYDHNVFVALNDRYIKSKKAIKKALGL